MFIDSTYLINKEELEEIEKIITCSICDGIINDPMECILCENNFCNHCIKKWKEKNVNCPFRCVNFSLKENIFLKKFLSDTLKFKCEKGCGQIISYSDFNEHYTISCPNIDKINYKQKFEDLRVEYEKLKIRHQIKIENNKKLREEIKNYIKSNNELIVENKVNTLFITTALFNQPNVVLSIQDKECIPDSDHCEWEDFQSYINELSPKWPNKDAHLKLTTTFQVLDESKQPLTMAQSEVTYNVYHKIRRFHKNELYLEN